MQGAEGELPSPLVLMGDSMTITPIVPDAPQNLVAHLTHACKLKPDLLTSLGSSAQAGRLLAREGGDFLANRLVLVFTFAPSRLFGSMSRVEQGV